MSKKREKVQNPVAKYAREFNHSRVFRDKTKYYRKKKHKHVDSERFDDIM